MLLLKLILVPLFVGLAAIAGRVWGASAAGLISGLPIIAGPIVWFIYYDQGLNFALNASASAIRGVIALSFFCFIYAWCSKQFNWVWSLLISILAYCFIAFCTASTNFSIHIYFQLAIVTIVLHIYFSPKASIKIKRVPASNTEIIARMFFALCLVWLITLNAAYLGNIYSGIFATFPIAGSAIALFSHKNHSADHAITSLKSMKYGLLGMLVFFYCLSWLGHLMMFNLAIVMSLTITLSIQFFILWIKQNFSTRISNPA